MTRHPYPTNRSLLRLESLEQRLTPATYIVQNLNNSGVGSLRQAILDSNASAEVDTIAFQPGLSGVITVLVPQLRISDDVTIAGPGASVIAVSGDNFRRVFDITDETPSVINVEISGLTVTEGRDQTGDLRGGGIRISNENVTLDRVVVSNCEARADFSFGLSHGGGIYVGGGGGRLTVRNSTITGNGTTGDGGGIALGGGGLGSSLLIENSTVSDNSCFLTGAGIFAGNNLTADGITIRNCTIANNFGTNGGGVRLELTSTPAPVLIQNSTITANNADTTSTTGGGGGIFATTAAGTVNIVSTIVSGNMATAGNGRSDIVADANTTLNVSFSAIGDPDGFTINGTNQFNLPFGAALGLQPLANNGGLTQTVAFAANSPLFNAGDNPAALQFDQRGFGSARVISTFADIGAFEFNPPGPLVRSVQVNDGTVQRSRVTSLTVRFNTQVMFFPSVSSAFTLSRPGGSVQGTATANVVNGVTVVTLANFTGSATENGSLSDGRYTLTVLANGVVAGGQQMGSNFTFGDSRGLFRFYGDMNGDRRVDISDFGFFSLAYLSTPNYNAALDFNNDGRIDIADFGQFSARFFTTLP